MIFHNKKVSFCLLLGLIIFSLLPFLFSACSDRSANKNSSSSENLQSPELNEFIAKYSAAYSSKKADDILKLYSKTADSTLLNKDSLLELFDGCDSINLSFTEIKVDKIEADRISFTALLNQSITVAAKQGIEKRRVKGKLLKSGANLLLESMLTVELID